VSFNPAAYAVETAFLNYFFELGYTFSKNPGATSQLGRQNGRMKPVAQ